MSSTVDGAKTYPNPPQHRTPYPTFGAQRGGQPLAVYVDAYQGLELASTMRTAKKERGYTHRGYAVGVGRATMLPPPRPMAACSRWCVRCGEVGGEPCIASSGFSPY